MWQTDDDNYIDFARLQYVAVTILGYTRSEYQFMAVGELCEQFETHCAMHGAPIDQQNEEVF